MLFAHIKAVGQKGKFSQRIRYVALLGARACALKILVRRKIKRVFFFSSRVAVRIFFRKFWLLWDKIGLIFYYYYYYMITVLKCSLTFDGQKIQYYRLYKWAGGWKKDLRTYANSEDPDQIRRPRNLVRILAFRLHKWPLLKMWNW